MAMRELLQWGVDRTSPALRERIGRLVRVPDPNRSPWHDLLPFTTHRIRLAGDLYTCELGVDPEIDLRTRLLIDRSAALGELPALSFLDLGCLEGGFAVELGRRGARRVVGLEYRDVSVQRCELARDLIGLDNVEFFCADVTNGELASGESFDVVLATGILYHVDRPDTLLGSIRGACKHFLLVDTHVASRTRSTHGCSGESELVSHDGEVYLGRWFTEFGEADSDQEREKKLWASSTNPTSFWPYEDELVRMIRNAGFQTATKIENTGNEPWQVDLENRVLYICET